MRGCVPGPSLAEPTCAPDRSQRFVGARAAWLYADRTARGDCDHRDPGRDVVAGVGPGQGAGAGSAVPEQRASARAGADLLCERQPGRFPAAHGPEPLAHAIAAGLSGREDPALPERPDQPRPPGGCVHHCPAGGARLRPAQLHHQWLERLLSGGAAPAVFVDRRQEHHRERHPEADRDHCLRREDDRLGALLHGLLRRAGQRRGPDRAGATPERRQAV